MRVQQVALRCIVCDAFCAGGDQKIRGDQGYVGDDGVPRLNILDVQKQIRYMPKPVVAMVAGYAVGGGHVLHMLCDLTIAADNAQFGQTGPRVGSFDGGWGASYMARIIGQKRAREIWFLCRFYDAEKALDWGLVNQVVPYEKLEEEDMLIPFCILIVQAFVMCIFTFSVPIEISKRVFELVILERNEEACLLRIIFKMLKHTEKRAVDIKGSGLYKYYSEATFVIDCFDELGCEKIFSC